MKMAKRQFRDLDGAIAQANSDVVAFLSAGDKASARAPCRHSGVAVIATQWASIYSPMWAFFGGRFGYDLAETRGR
jgi:hypothetical protein